MTLYDCAERMISGTVKHAIFRTNHVMFGILHVSCRNLSLNKKTLGTDITGTKTINDADEDVIEGKCTELLPIARKIVELAGV